MEIKLLLTLDEVNGVIGTLSMLPFGQVTGLVNKIRDQAIPQVQAAEATAKATNGAANETTETEGGDAA